MTTAAGGSGSSPSPSGGKNGKETGHRAGYIPLSGDGKAPATATWSPALYTSPPGPKNTYVVDGIGLFPRFRRTTLVDARSFAQTGYTILDGDTYQVVTQLPAGPMVNPSMLIATGVSQHIVQVADAETALAIGTGQASQQYNAAQVHRE
jgi:hypothetical protein